MDPRLETLQRAIAEAVEGMSGEGLRRHPAGKWCAAEVLEHLCLTYTGTTKGFDRVLESAKPLASPVSVRQRLRTFVVVGLGYMPEGRKSPPMALPRAVSAEHVREGINEAIIAMDNVMNRCETAMGKRKKVLNHPMLGALTVRQWRKFHLVHGLHHVKQLHRLRQLPG